MTSVTKSFGPQIALRDVTLDIQRGEVFGIVGESGAGKSTLLNLLTGELTPDSGSLEVLGEDLGTLSGAGLRGLRQRIGVLFQDVHLLSNLTVGRNVGVPLRIAAGHIQASVGTTGRWGIRGGGRREERRQSVEQMLSFVGLSGYGDRFPSQLSGGQQQRVGIARALASNPELLLCDEPTSALDTTTAAGILKLLADARDRLGTAVIIVTHDLDAVRAICDRAALFEQGELMQVLRVNKSHRSADQSYLERAREVLEGE